MGKVVRIDGRPWCHAGEFRGYRLAQDDGAGRAQERHARRIAGGAIAAIDRRSHLGRQTDGIDNVLDPNRDPVQRAAAGSAIKLARLTQRQRGIHIRKGMNRRLARRDALEAGPRYALRRDLTGRDPASDFGRGKLVEALPCHGCDARSVLPGASRRGAGDLAEDRAGDEAEPPDS